MGTIKTVNLGFPRMGRQRELKTYVESFLKRGSSSVSDEKLLAETKELRLSHIKLQSSFNITYIPSNDFSLYDHVLDHITMFNCVPARYKALSGLEQYFAMARGFQAEERAIDLQALEMKKWFDTNYHYIVPEFEEAQKFTLNSSVIKPIEEYLEAKNELGLTTRPVVLGPITFLLLGKCPSNTSFNNLCLLDNLLEAYSDLFKRMQDHGIEDVQLDEPFLCLLENYNISDSEAFNMLNKVYNERLSNYSIKMHIVTYFSYLSKPILKSIAALNIESLHIDLVRWPPQMIDLVTEQLSKTSIKLSLGVVDGRNIWKSDMSHVLDTVNSIVKMIGSERVIVGPSCSLQFVPYSLESEESMDSEIKYWLSFACEKLEEISLIPKLIQEKSKFNHVIEANLDLISKRKSSKKINNQSVQERVQNINKEMLNRKSPFIVRKHKQAMKLNLPKLFPTTTIGSFPQTKEVRAMRLKHKKGRISNEEYEAFIKGEIKRCIAFQEEIGLDVLVHGEFERNDMVEYFGENLNGYVFTMNGWVQSYGTRCVKPPIIYGDVSRSSPITVKWSEYAMSLTNKPIKGMLTGPITCMQWSFVRNDQSKEKTAFQLALAIRDEVVDLEKAGAKCIQIDEPAIREGLPLKKSEWKEYLNYAVNCFKLSASGVSDETQIHTHVCYSDFNDIFSSIKMLDADAIFIENSRSDLKLLNAFSDNNYENYMGPGVYDIHSPRVPTIKEMKDRVKEMIKAIDKELIWINPDCGLKTRHWEEVISSLKNMVSVATELRAAEN